MRKESKGVVLRALFGLVKLRPARPAKLITGAQGAER